ncbi:MAG: phytanoyl-CoA dioxygenase family protein [Phenylobacterium sp.]|uniref:phytanoyl-CoA dioxygenase family protein n=1 Tax=Phenylobacterium sp. TaxID=1871053 RepID=UPI001A541BCE|nr:phytanoyl-CoA dioxygenase family protein [Phenylobacterium sp.]MBL8553649.1 phytanoyl-CoA dioxygenase family protein [Phenylobacterium sp.]
MIRRGMPYLEYRTEPASPETGQLEREGYAILRGLLSPDEVAELRDEIGAIFERDPPDERGNRPFEDAQMFRYAMLNRSPAAQRAVANPKLLAVIEPLLGEDCHVIANTAWRNPAGQPGSHGGQNWHVDAGPHIPLPDGAAWPADIPHPVFAVGVHVYLQDCTLEDGPTGVLPGSHLSGKPPPRGRHLDDTLTYEGREVVPFVVEAGDAGFFVSDVWHRRMPTTPGADAGRFFLQVHYGRRDIAQRILTTAHTNHLSPEAVARAEAGSERDRRVVGLHTPFFYDG